jgi:hypothetical protein
MRTTLTLSALGHGALVVAGLLIRSLFLNCEAMAAFHGADEVAWL